MKEISYQTRRDPCGLEVRWDEALARRWHEEGYWLDTTLARLTENLSRTEGDREMIVDGAKTFTLRELVIESRRLARALQKHGIGPGSVISYQLPNWYEAGVINLAASYIGAVINPLVPIYRDNEIRFMLNDVKSRMVFVPKVFRNHGYAEMMLRVRERLHQPLDIVVVHDECDGCLNYDAFAATGDEKTEFPEVDPDSIYVMMHTSGTTGHPKCVLHSHNTFLVQGKVHALEFKKSERDILIVATPISHIAGIILANLTPTVGGAKIVLMDQWSPSEAVAHIRRHGATSLGGAPPFLSQLLEAAREQNDHLPSLTGLGVGGAAVPADLIRNLQDWFPNAHAYRVYGCTEVPTATAGSDGRDDVAHGNATDGKVKYVDLKIVDASSGIATKKGDEGEMLLRGPQMMLGYLRREDNIDAFDEEGYFKTGDLGRVVDNDYLVITGRKKEIIIRSGENLSPKEIEDLLHTHPAISSAACVGMPHPRTGECVCAFVVTRPGQTVTLDDLDAFLQSAGLSRRKVPEHLEILEEMPLSPQLKIKKTELKERAAAIARQRFA